ncbi:PKD domain-containing protein [Geofilum sp. OHC36d9]|uniref:PKD domain-containing protein n=1 Tax=Geofilum sp. OHC36d9 TaxID=3458413 RepID=UPI004034D865
MFPTLNIKKPQLTIAILLLASHLSAQTTIDFTVNTDSGCAPLNVTFNNTSQSPEDLSYEWDFGNGNTSTIPNPQTTFITPGKYTITLTASDGENSYTKSKEAYITVVANPVAFFVYDGPSEGCVPFEATFENQSTDPINSPLSYTWSFGDGERASEETPTHIYNAAGIYDITLVVENEFGCQSAYTLPQKLEAVKPKALFGVNPSASCTGELSVVFSNLSIARTGFNSSWSFGDATTSTQTTPVHYYEEPGSYNVKLKITDDLGCTDSTYFNNLINITNTTSDFSASTTKGCVGDTIYFTNLSKDAGQYQWSFGDGTSSSVSHPKKVYTQPGDYKITLTASNGTCSEQKQITINIEQAHIDFKVSDQYICQLPATLTYESLSSNAVSYDWRFGNGATSTQASPTVNFSETTKLTDFRAVFSDTLTITTANGCKSTLVKPNNVEIHLPHVMMNPGDGGNSASLNGCIPMGLTFNDQSEYNSDVDEIISYEWLVNGSDRRTGTSTDVIVLAPKKTPIQLTVTTQKGCVASATEYINAGQTFEANFVRTSNYETCADEMVTFEITSPNKKFITNEVWDFGDDAEPGLSMPTHFYEKTGLMDVTLTIYNNGCPSKIIKKNYVKILGPYASFTIETNCSQPLQYQFESNVIDATDYTWDFGDGSPLVSNVANPTHTYATSGNYRVQLNATNSETGCEFSYVRDVYPRKIKSNFTIEDAAPCLNATLTLDGSTSEEYSPFSYNKETIRYLWLFNEESEITGSMDVLQHTFKHKGLNHISLITQDINGCRDTLTKEIMIYQPEPDFDVDYEVGCMPITFKFADKTTSDAVITDWEWNFGDNTTASIQHPAHEYTQYGQYSVSLSVTDEQGCSNSINKEQLIKTITPEATFKANNNQLCINDTTTFHSTSGNEIDTYQWAFSNGITVTDSDPQIQFTEAGYYTVSLHITDIHGCEAFGEMENYIHVQAPPQANFSADITESNCYPLIVQFSNDTKTDYPGTWQWYFGENSNQSQLKDPFFIYNRPGAHDVRLISRTTYGCTDTITKTNFINVDGPYAQFSLPDSACLNSDIAFNATNLEKVYDLAWDFGDGAGTNDNNITHAYSTPGNKYPLLFLRTDAENTCNVALIDTLHILDLHTTIDYYNQSDEFCPPAQVAFKDNSVNATSWLWQFNDNTLSDLPEPVKEFQTAGTYPVTLTIQHTKLGCEYVTKSEIVIHPLPDVKVSPDTVICTGDAATLQAAGGLHYQWWPTDHLSTPDAAVTMATPKNDEWYQVTVTNQFGCINYGTTNIYVQQKPVITLADTTLIVGETMQIDITDPGIAYYDWTPATQLSCYNCPSPILQALESKQYSITVTDTTGCFSLTYPFNLTVNKIYSVDVPEAFTPNNDGINEKIFVKGWGIEKLITFKIYNRFGQIVYESNNINEGWDGTYKGSPQPVETYTYVAQVMLYDQQIRTIKGTIKLLR